MRSSLYPGFGDVSSVLICFVSPAPGISASPSEENLRYFNVMILGPSQSPYEGTVNLSVKGCSAELVDSKVAYNAKIAIDRNSLEAISHRS